LQWPLLQPSEFYQENIHVDNKEINFGVIDHRQGWFFLCEPWEIEEIQREHTVNTEKSASYETKCEYK